MTSKPPISGAAGPAGTAQKDLAERLGLSRATVSLALAGDRRVAAATRRRVEEAARGAGYRPDPLLAALSARGGRKRRGGPAGKICLLGPKASFAPDKVHLIELERELKAAAGAQGFSVEAAMIERGGLTPERMGDILYHRGVNALVVGGNPGEDFMARFPWERFAVVSVSSQLRRHAFDHLVMDHLESCQQVWEAVSRGNWRRVLVCLHADVDQNLQRRLSYHWEGLLGAAGEQWVGSRVLPVFAEKPGAADEMLRAVEAVRPGLIVLHEWRVAAVARRAGLRFPRDAAAVCMSLTDTSSGLAGVRHSYAALAMQILATLGGKLRRGERGARPNRAMILVRGDWTPGPSLPGSGAGQGPSGNAFRPSQAGCTGRARGD